MPKAPHRVSPAFGTKWKRGRSTKSSHLNTGHSGNDVASIFFSKLLEKSMPTIVYVYLHTSGRQSREAKRSLITSQRQDHCVLNCLKHLSRLENIGIRSFIHTCYTYVYITIRVIHNVLHLKYSSILLSILFSHAE